MKTTPLCCAFLLACLNALANDTVPVPDIPLRYRSPDGVLTAIVVPLGRDLGAKRVAGDSEYECRIEIYSRKGCVWTQDFSSPDHDHGRGVAFARWSPDSRWFVFSTMSSGGHHPWQAYTYAFDRAGKSIYLLDSFVGEVIQSEFTFGRADTISLQIYDRTVKNPTEEWPLKTVTVSLSKLLVRKIPQPKGIIVNPPMYSPYQ